MKYLQLLLLATPIFFRQYDVWKAARIGKPRSARLGGTPSVTMWFLSYITLLGFAVEALVYRPIGLLGWIGYGILWAAVGIRSRALRALRGFYDEAIMLRENHRVITNGIYRYLRHPLHSGLLGEMIGLALLGDRWYSIGILIAAFIVLVARNRHEERALEQYLGAPYAEYQKTAWDITDIIPRFRS